MQDLKALQRVPNYFTPHTYRSKTCFDCYDDITRLARGCCFHNPEQNNREYSAPLFSVVRPKAILHPAVNTKFDGKNWKLWGHFVLFCFGFCSTVVSLKIRQSRFSVSNFLNEILEYK